MTESLKQHYLQCGTYTYAGLYRDYFRSLPDDIRELGNLVCSQVIHRVTLKQGNTNANQSLIYGDMNHFPWHRQRCEDDIFMTACAMTAELFRLDERGFTKDRTVENKLVLTCRYVSILVAAIFKAKGIPCRCRSGFAPYFEVGKSCDHWINQVWNDEENRWITLDADGFYEECGMPITQFDIPESRFDWAADAWLKVRQGKTDGTEFLYADCNGTNSLKAIIRAIFYDFHALMNHEISYQFQPCYIDGKFEQLSERDLQEIDSLAVLMQKPDENFQELVDLWNTKRKFRVLNSPLVGDRDTLPLIQ